jgi:hypothetical protein
MKSVVPQTVGDALFELKNDISIAKLGIIYHKQTILD